MPLIVLGLVMLLAGLAGRFLLEDPMLPTGIALVGGVILLLGYLRTRSGGQHAKKPRRPKAAAPAAEASQAAAPAEATPKKPSLWKRLNQPMGKGKAAAPAEAAEPKRRRGRRKKKDEDEGPLFPKEILEAEPLELHLSSQPAAGLEPTEPPTARSIGPAQPLAAQPGTSTEGTSYPVTELRRDLGVQPGVGEAVPPTADVAALEAPAEPDRPSTEAVVQQLQEVVARPRGHRVCAYCWQPNEPGADRCTACGETLKIA